MLFHLHIIIQIPIVMFKPKRGVCRGTIYIKSVFIESSINTSPHVHINFISIEKFPNFWIIKSSVWPWHPERGVYFFLKICAEILRIIVLDGIEFTNFWKVYQIFPLAKFSGGIDGHHCWWNINMPVFWFAPSIRIAEKSFQIDASKKAPWSNQTCAHESK